MDIKKIVSEIEYQDAAGPDWPSYQSFLDGNIGQDPNTRQEIDAFAKESYQDYIDKEKGNKIADGNRTWQSQVFFDKRSTIPPSERCQVPWKTMGVNSYGDVFICQSPAWIPKFVGNVNRADTVYDILNSDMAIKIRREILSDRYFYCNNHICSFFDKQPKESYQFEPTQDSDFLPLQDDIQHPSLFLDRVPENLIFDFDYTCNFRCPSCRTDLINNNKHSVIRPINNRISERIKTLVIDEIKDHPTSIRWAGGEPFISDVYSDLLEYIIGTGKRNITHIIQTNGSYLKSKSDIVEGLLPYLKELRISFDAATPETYHRVRVNGVWDNLLNNVRWVMDKIRENNFPVTVTADFVVQKSNYQEILAFSKLCQDLGIHNINYQKMWDWHSWPKEEFNQHNVYTHNHPKYEQVVRFITQAKNENTSR